MRDIVERIGYALHSFASLDPQDNWHQLPERTRAYYRSQAEVAIDAMQLGTEWGYQIPGYADESDGPDAWGLSKDQNSQVAANNGSPVFARLVTPWVRKPGGPA